jgi:hypothetical protein
MKLTLEQAQRNLDAGDLDPARNNLDIAEALDNRVLKAGGR